MCHIRPEICSWATWNAETIKSLNVFEMWTLRRMQPMQWTAKITNKVLQRNIMGRMNVVEDIDRRKKNT